MKNIFKQSAAILTACCLAVGSAFADPTPGKGHGKPDKHDNHQNGKNHDKDHDTQDTGISVTLTRAGISVTQARDIAYRNGIDLHG